ncbi:hypothetical protein Pla8534_26730 [Lignipirellula cremea]|uniref:DUF1501 domain-containing protein n=2 Tax=Lignipirellula cremea TaxID=2528010 RepID=A0A518DSP8_9BACT|nr:hypothetical protein Pla8534_26730 [Lignipirellula cremea]
MLGAGGLTLSQLLQFDERSAQAGRIPDRERSVIILWMRGGPSQHDQWDPKPDAPVEIRGEFAPISTSVPGIQISEMQPKCAAIMDKWSIVRSLHHRKEDGNVGHSNGDQICFTGYPAGPSSDVNVMPSVGSHVARQQQHMNPSMPAYVMVPRHVPGTGSAWFGPAYGAFETIADPAADGPFKVPNFEMATGLSPDRIRQRQQLLSSLNRSSLSDVQMAAADKFQDKALDIVTSGAARQAFDLDAEPRSVRERYGFMPAFDPGDPQRCGSPNWAQRMLLSRRLVEAGVRLVTVDLRWWDFHKEGFDSQRRGFLPRFDQAYTALIEDLEQHGLLEKTLVVAWGEIGRTPRINANAGRDHWPYVFSAAFAGGGVQGGRVVGSSDRQGGVPKDNPKLPHDVLATIYRHLGVDATQQYVDSSGRPHPVLPQGKAIDELF